MKKEIVKEKLSRELSCSRCGKTQRFQFSEVDNTIRPSDRERALLYLMKETARGYGWSDEGNAGFLCPRCSAVHTARVFALIDRREQFEDGIIVEDNEQVEEFEVLEDIGVLRGPDETPSNQKRRFETLEEYLKGCFGLTDEDPWEEWFPEIFSFPACIDRRSGKRLPLDPEILAQIKSRLAIELDLDVGITEVRRKMHDILWLDDNISLDEHFEKLWGYVRHYDEEEKASFRMYDETNDGSV